VLDNCAPSGDHFNRNSEYPANTKWWWIYRLRKGLRLAHASKYIYIAGNDDENLETGEYDALEVFSLREIDDSNYYEKYELMKGVVSIGWVRFLSMFFLIFFFFVFLKYNFPYCFIYIFTRHKRRKEKISELYIFE
jgi:hypothetical protein